MDRTAATDWGDVIFRDGIGERRLVSGPHAQQREVLCVRSELSAVSSFEPAVRERLGRLESFRHAYYAHAHGVEKLADQDSTLGLVSDSIDGTRLSDLFARAAARGLNLDINAALCLIRQLVPAVAKLHEMGSDLAHAAIGPERVVVTPNARLVITEYVLGPALEQLRYSQERYWRDLRIALPRSAGLPRFDQRADVTQIGALALSLVLGRLLRDDEYPSRIGDVVASAWAVSPKGGFEPLPPGIRGWLGRALQLDVRNSFPSAIEANADLEQVLADSEYMGSPASLELFLSRYEASQIVDVPSADASSVDEGPAAASTDSPAMAALETALSAEPDLQSAPSAIAPPPTSRAASSTPSAQPVAARTRAVRPIQPSLADAQVEADAVREDVASVPTAISGLPDMFGQPERPSRGWGRWGLACGAVAVVLVAIGTPWARSRAVPPPAAPPQTGTLSVNTNPPGALAVIDGQPRGTTPLTLSLAPGPHTVELRGAGEPRTLPVTIAAGSQTSQYVELPHVVASVGQLSVRTEPAGASVTVDGVRRGTAPMVVTDLTPGEHTVLLESESGAVRQPVRIESGVVTSLVVPLVGAGATASGWMAVVAPIELQIRQGDRVLGTSLSDRIMVPVGRHDVELVNDTFDFHASRTVQVSAGRVATLKIEIPNGTMAVNALPWADVWLDGERVGETPIGNLPVRIGVHDVVLKHPELGERRHRLTVTSTGVARLSVDLRKP